MEALKKCVFEAVHGWDQTRAWNMISWALESVQNGRDGSIIVGRTTSIFVLFELLKGVWISFRGSCSRFRVGRDAHEDQKGIVSNQYLDLR